MQNNTPPVDDSVEEVPSNIIKFPKPHKNPFVGSNLEELILQAAQNKMDFVSFLSAELIEELFYKLSIMGFTFDDPSYIKDSVMVVEALKSLMLKTMGIEHSLQHAAEKLIELPDIDSFEDYLDDENE
jgi:hypothetical protein